MSAAFRMVEPGSALDMDPDLLAIRDPWLSSPPPPLRRCYVTSRCAARVPRPTPRSGTTAPAYTAQASSSEPHCTANARPRRSCVSPQPTRSPTPGHQTRSIAGVLPAPHDRYRRRGLRIEPDERPRAPARAAVAHRLNERERPRAVRSTGQHHSRHDSGWVRCTRDRDGRRHGAQTNDPRQARGISTPPGDPPELASAGRGSGADPRRLDGAGGGSLDLGPRSWVVTLGDLERDALDCVLQPLVPSLPPSSIRSLLQPPRRLLPAPVGSRAWLELLAAGGGEVEDGTPRAVAGVVRLGGGVRAACSQTA